MTPEGPPERQPPRIVHRSGGLPGNSGRDARPKPGPVGVGYGGARGLDDQRPETPNHVRLGRTVGTGAQVRLQEPRGSGSQRAIDMALHSRTSPEAGESWHGGIEYSHSVTIVDARVFDMEQQISVEVERGPRLDARFG